MKAAAAYCWCIWYARVRQRNSARTALAPGAVRVTQLCTIAQAVTIAVGAAQLRRPGQPRSFKGLRSAVGDTSQILLGAVFVYLPAFLMMMC